MLDLRHVNQSFRNADLGVKICLLRKRSSSRARRFIKIGQILRKLKVLYSENC